MDINLALTLPMWLTYGYPALGTVALAIFTVWEHRRTTPRPKLSLYIKPRSFLSYLIFVSIWPVAVAVMLKDKRAQAKYRSEREKERAQRERERKQDAFV